MAVEIPLPPIRQSPTVKVDEYAKLGQTSFRGIPFPLASMDNSFTHDHVEHKWIYVDGTHIEATGRNGLVMHAIMPFHNNIIAGPSEGWRGQVLYPTLFTKMRLAVEDRSSGPLMHPELGLVNVKARDVQWRTENVVGRDGVTLSVRFYASLDDSAAASLIAQQSPIAAMQNNAGVLDGELKAAEIKKGPLPELKNDKRSFTDMVGDFINGSGALDPIKSKTQNTSALLDRLNSVEFWSLRSANENMIYSMHDVGTNNNRNNNPIQFHVTQGSTSISRLSSILKVKVEDLITLNPKLLYGPSVPKGTTVNYYAPGSGVAR